MTTSSSSPKSSVILLATQPFITSQFTFLRSTFRSYSFGNLRVLRSLASLLQSHKNNRLGFSIFIARNGEKHTLFSVSVKVAGGYFEKRASETPDTARRVAMLQI